MNVSRAMAPAGLCSRLSLVSASSRSWQCRAITTQGMLLRKTRAPRAGAPAFGRSSSSTAGMQALFGVSRFLPTALGVLSTRCYTPGKSAAVSTEEEDAEDGLMSLKERVKGKDGEIEALNKSLKGEEEKTKSLKLENMKMAREMDKINSSTGRGASAGQRSKLSAKAAAAAMESDDESDFSELDDSEIEDALGASTESEVEEDVASDSDLEKEFKKLESGSDSDFDVRAENGKEVSDLSDSEIEDVLASKQRVVGHRQTLDSSIGGEVMDAWRKFVALLKQKNYFKLNAEELVKGEAAYESFSNIAEAFKRFSTERDDILKMLPMGDLKVLASHPCPTTLRKAVNSGKRLRGFCNVEEAEVCKSCSKKDDCSRAYLPPDSTASTSDALQYLFQFVVCTSEGSDFPEKTKTAVKNILRQLTSLGAVSRDPTLPRDRQEVIAKPKTSRPQNENYEMKPGDWKCVECDYINFCRNRHCRECHTPRPPQDLRPGDWECPECRFVNFARNEECHDCKAERPDTVKVFHTIKGTKEKWEGSPEDFARQHTHLERKAKQAQGKYSDGLSDSDDDFKVAPKRTTSLQNRRMASESESDLDEDSDDKDFDVGSRKNLGKKQSKNDAWNDDSDDDDDFTSSKRGGGQMRGRGRGAGFASRASSLREDDGGGRGRSFTSGRGRGGRASFAKDSEDDLDDSLDDSDDDDMPRRGARGGRGGSFTTRGGRGARGRGGGRFDSEDDSMDDLSDDDDDFGSSRGGRGRGARGRGRGGLRSRLDDDLDDDSDDVSEDDRFSRGGRGGRGGARGALGRGSRFGHKKFDASDDASDLDSDDFLSEDDEPRFGRGRGRGRGGGGRGRYGNGDDFSDESDDDGGGGGRFGGRGRGGGRFGSRGGGYGGRGGGYGDRDDFRGGRGGYGDRDDFRGGRGGYGDRDGGFRGGRGGYGDRDGGGFRGGRGGFGDRDDFRGGRGGRGGYGDRDDFRSGGGFRGGRGGRGGFGDRDDFGGGRGGGGGFRGGGRGGFRGRGGSGFRGQDY
ncbi:uncharacterized protein LOC9655451 [Selaginella moellendorffii]|uniref:uncharacterized protein LOC9655451 n=1 Tax=Selaginella moellendorffii TaxID=88036 RepID=UPI000D1CDD1D|nr:uncharacterized protein LOC9655451 [Selaginella moellendorffii]|eukprot:XP_024524172.1 uncharacterized protein LOC9655451 [Selaginella moellendorffii]